MKKVYLVTLCTCLVVIAFVSASVYFLRDEEKEITVGFVYVGDASTAYTSNFIDAQEAIQTKYGDQVKAIALIMLQRERNQSTYSSLWMPGAT